MIPFGIYSGKIANSALSKRAERAHFERASETVARSALQSPLEATCCDAATATGMGKTHLIRIVNGVSNNNQCFTMRGAACNPSAAFDRNGWSGVDIYIFDQTSVGRLCLVFENLIILKTARSLLSLVRLTRQSQSGAQTIDIYSNFMRRLDPPLASMEFGGR